jgi:thiamine-phosphate pyrophosphorylase
MSHPLLRRRGLYAITNGPRSDLLVAVQTALEGGATLVQYRDKTDDHKRRLYEATTLSKLCAPFDVPLIVNDDIGLARTSGAAGVHLGEHDLSIAQARAALGDDAIVGVSCYDSLQRARDAAAAGANYLAFGAFFPSSTKRQAHRATPDLLRAARALGKPLVAIGGVTPDNGRSLVAAGADFLAAISAVFDAPDIGATTRRFTDLFDATESIR